MKDEITINLNALDDTNLEKLASLLSQQTEIVPDDTNEDALAAITNYILEEG